MAGLYLHIPFCKQACHYCNFHFSTNLKGKGDLLDVMHQELELQRDYLQGQPLESIYLGGGTPSLLNEKELFTLLEKIYSLHSVSDQAEITMETNPDDLSGSYLRMLKNSPVNRLSIGIQSFFEEDLRWMNRAHDSDQAHRCLVESREQGFENISIDLIYGSPTTSDKNWEKNLDYFFEYKIPHLSSYALTVEEGTALGSWVAKGKVKPIDTERSLSQFQLLVAAIKAQGYRHYEISNFAYPGFEAIHNSNYWKGKHYLGIGPAAHSFNGKSRQWNVANNIKYIKALKNKQPIFEVEILSKQDRFNEYIMTGLRCDWGINEQQIKSEFPLFYHDFSKEKERQLTLGALVQQGDQLILSEAAKFLADGIAAEFFVTPES